MIHAILLPMKNLPKPTILAAGLLLILTNLTTLLLPLPTLLRAPLFVLFVLFFGFLTGKTLLKKQPAFWQLTLGSLTLICGLSIILSGIYWFYELNTAVASIVSTLVAGTLTLLHKKSRLQTSDFRLRFSKTSIIPTTIFLLDGILIAKLLSIRFDDTLASPWTIVGPKFFALFFVSTCILLFSAFKLHKHKIIVLSATVLHYVLILSVALIVFRFGYGFDPFIHQASEQWILAHGTITPKVPYYIGQYMLVVMSHMASGISIFTLDHMLVPVGSAILLPLFGYFSFAKKIKPQYLLPAITLLPFVPLAMFIHTTPNNLGLLIGALLAFLIWHEWNHATTKTHVVGLALVGMSLVTHAFIGIPLALVYTASILLKKRQKILYLIPYPLILSLALPLVMFFYIDISLAPFLENPLAAFTNFLSVFTFPHYYFFAEAPIHWQTLYGYKVLIIPAALYIGILGWIRSKKKTAAGFLLLSGIAIFASGVLIGVTFSFTELISYEQSVYADRLLDLALVLLLPCVLFGLVQISKYLQKKRALMLVPIPILALALLVSWYFTYPTVDTVSKFRGFSVRSADIEAVQFIADRNTDGEEYIVLTNQTVGAAALREFSFENYLTMNDGTEQYFYSVPTGAPLYGYFRKMVYEDPQRQWMLEAMDYAGVDKAYFIHTNYWYPAAYLRDKAKPGSNQWWELGNGRVWVYEYSR